MPVCSRVCVCVCLLVCGCVNCPLVSPMNKVIKDTGSSYRLTSYVLRPCLHPHIHNRWATPSHHLPQTQRNNNYSGSCFKDPQWQDIDQSFRQRGKGRAVIGSVFGCSDHCVCACSDVMGFRAVCVRVCVYVCFHLTTEDRSMHQWALRIIVLFSKCNMLFSTSYFFLSNSTRVSLLL